MKIEWNRVTWYSKWLALLLVIVLPIIGFVIGIRYGELIGYNEGILSSLANTSNRSSAGTTNNPAKGESTKTNIISAGGDCVQEYARRFVREYNYTEQYTLTKDELNSYLNIMGVKSICFPKIFGLPYLNVDWNADTNGADSGRKISIGFETLQDQGGGWGGYMEFTTYNFALGTEYNTYASIADYQAVLNSTKANIISVNGTKGFVLYSRFVDLGGEKGDIEKVVIFPFENHYVAFLYPLKGSGNEPDRLMQELYTGYSEQYREELMNFDNFVSSVHFNE